MIYALRVDATVVCRYDISPWRFVAPPESRDIIIAFSSDVSIIHANTSGNISYAKTSEPDQEIRLV